MLKENPLYRLLVLSVGHASVDAYAGMIGPLMLVFAASGAFHEDSAKMLPAVMAAASSLTQPLVGLLGDRGLPRAVFLAGPVFAAGGIALAIVAAQPGLVVALLIVSGLGIAAYHPEAAALSSAGVAGRPALTVSIFLFGGTVGLWLGPVTCGLLIDHLPVRTAALVLAAPGLIVGLILVAVAVAARERRAGERSHFPAVAEVPTQDEVRRLLERINWPLVSLTAQATLRAMVMAAVGVVVPWWGQRHGLNLTQIGHLSGMFLFAGGIGMLLVGWLSTMRRQLPLLAGTALVGTIPIVLLGGATTFWQAACCIVIGGMLCNGPGAMIVSMAQQVAPRGARTASALTMGFAWGLGGVVGPLIVSWVGNDAAALWICAGALVPAAVLAASLPKPRHERGFPVVPVETR